MTSVMIFRGHGDQPSGRHDPGAVGGGWSEQDAADIVAPVVTADLTAAGVDVHDEGTDDDNFVGSVAEANRRAVDLVVALHWDWTGGLDVHAFHHSTSTVGKALATAIVDALADTGAVLADNPVRDRDGLYVIRETEMPAVLVELGRIGEFGDAPTAHLEQLGHAVAAGILDHLGIDAPDPTPDHEPSPTPARPWQEEIIAAMNTVNLSDVDPDDKSTWVRGEDVRTLQCLLVARRHAPANTIDDDGDVDGIAGPGTKRALGDFQRATGTGHPSGRPDYIAGRKTWSALTGG